MPNDEKEKFQILSKEDRNRYENQREEFTQKKEVEGGDEFEHNVIETVKNRAKILEDEKKKRK